MKGSSEESIESVKPSNLQAFANISTLHGMSHIFAYGHMTFRRFLWTLSFLGSLGLLMLVCMDRVSYYLEYPHVTKLDEVAATNLTFPAVTFCNLNEFRFSKITRNDLYHVGELLALLNNNYQIANPHLAEPEVLAALKDKANFQNFKPKLFNMTDFYNRTGHDIGDMLLQCTFRGEDCYPVNFTTLQYLPPPWGDCKSTPIDSEFFSTYSITACRIDCETRYLLENCNCRMVHMPGTSTVCTPEQYKDCADPALDFLVEKDNEYCVCQTPCNMTRYGKELSMVKIPSKASAKYLAKKFNKTEQYIGENILVLDIFFEALNYEKIEQKKAYEIAGLLGDIGGQMGLFIGASVLTILEIFDYLYEVFKDKVLGYFIRKKRPQRCQSDNLDFQENPTSPGVTPNHNPRAHVTPSGVTRTASDSRRTCYLVTRL
ncbi:acid-sensing ion channel 1C isoform 5-T5 [Xenentodon cancila]